jgi:hypothetical protein
MKNIKSFIYLDDYKMYSISSQIFEGLTESMVRSKSKEYSEGETQKGKIGKGRLMADILVEYTNHTEKRFLHDYSYTIFEEALINEGKVLHLEKDNIRSKIGELENYHFVKITGQMVFNDSKILVESIKNFNLFGSAIAHLTMKNEIDQINKLKEETNKIKDRNKKAIRSAKIPNVKKQLIEMGYNLEDSYLKDLVYLIEHGYKSQLEAQIPFPNDEHNCLFSGVLNRDYLKDDEHRIIRKYSRETEKDFTVFGILTQTSRNINDKTHLEKLKLNIDNQNIVNEKEASLKEALMEVVASLMDIDKKFIGRSDYEYILDPIAIYREI